MCSLKALFRFFFWIYCLMIHYFYPFLIYIFFCLLLSWNVFVFSCFVFFSWFCSYAHVIYLWNECRSQMYTLQLICFQCHGWECGFFMFMIWKKKKTIEEKNIFYCRWTYRIENWNKIKENSICASWNIQVIDQTNKRKTVD